MKNFKEVTDTLYGLIPTARIAVPRYGQDNIQAVLTALGSPQNTLHVFHVAGTSGKTSTCYYLAEMMRVAGYKVGLTVSPHVDSVRERLQINGVSLSEDVFTEYFSEFWHIVAPLKIQISYFECMVAFAFWVFAKEDVEYAVVEVGLGGRNDATNMINRADKICVITDIGFDHTEVLGDTLPKIAYEKAGIILPENKVYINDHQPIEVENCIREVANTVHADLHVVNESSVDAPASLPTFQQRNWRLAYTVAASELTRRGKQSLPVRVAAQIVIPARMEVLHYKNKTIILDGAHNGQKMHALVESVKKNFPDGVSVLAAFAAAKNTRAYEALDELLPVAKQIIFTAFSSEQDEPKVSIPAEDLQKYAHKKGHNSTIIQNPAEALSTLIHGTTPVILVCGSFYLMNHIRPVLKGVL